MQVTELASRYAEALFEITESSSSSTEVFEHLRELDRAFSQDPALFAFFLNPAVDNTQKQDLAQKALSSQKLDPLLVDFVMLLIRRNRLVLLSQICEGFQN